MSHFHRALRASELGQAAKPIRILWLGDSHAAADYWPNTVRATLQQRFGVGGPGFVHLGVEHYRHADVAMRRQGPWKVEPEPPSSRAQQGDGVFGLGGIRTALLAPDSRLTVSLGKGAVRGRAHWTVFARLDAESSALTMRVGSTTQTLRRQPNAAVVDPLAIDLVGEPTESLVIEGAMGRPRLFGAIVESEAGGLVLDTLGINGARVETALAWSESSWEAAVAERDPALVILEYGTNEVFDALAPERYEAQYAALLERVARVSPEAACLLIGPTAVGRGGLEAQRRASRIEGVQRLAAEHSGCMFFSTAAAMGGQDSFARWAQQSPALASSDGVHLTAAGYKAVGQATAAMLLDEYQRFVDREQSKPLPGRHSAGG